MNKHPHAELMKLYAEDAASTNYPWELWEVRNTLENDGANDWKGLRTHPTWNLLCEYRRRDVGVDDGIEIAGITFPKINIAEAPQRYEAYFYTIIPTDHGLGVEMVNKSIDSFDKFHSLLEQGLVFERRGDCEMYINALISLNRHIYDLGKSQQKKKKKEKQNG